MRISQLFFSLTLILLLQGCFFLFIPGSAVDAMSDAVTGSEGANCVGPVAKVGDTINLPDGSQGTIKSLSGTSVRCKDTRYPIRALLVPVASGPVATTPAQTNVHITFPAGWESKPLTPKMASGGAVAFATNRTIDAGALLSVGRREGITDPLAFATSRRANQESLLKETQSTDVTELDINGRKAYRFTVTGTGSTGHKITYMQTIIIGDSEVALLNTWATAAGFDTVKDALMRLSIAVTGA